MALQVVQPITVTPAMLVDTNVAENDYSEYAGGTTYALADRVIVATDHKVYESLAGSNTGHTPASSPTWWIEVSPTNRWKAFDVVSSTQTQNTGSISYTLQYGAAVTTIGFVRLEASTVRVRVVTSIGTTSYDQTYDIGTDLTESTWYDYFFEPCFLRPDFVVSDVPGESTATILIDIDYGANTAKIGVIAAGTPVTIGGGIRYGASTGIRDYSVKQTNDFGDTDFVVRNYAKRAEFRMFVENDVADLIQAKLAMLRATPSLWIGHAEYSRTIVFGYYRDFDMLISYPTESELSIAIEGLT